MLVETCKQPAGFSGGSGQLTPTNSQSTGAKGISTTGEHDKQNTSGDVTENGFRAKENQRSLKHTLDEEESKSRARNIPKNQKIGVVFNYSKMKLTPAMESLLNRGLNFSILPLKLDITQVLVDFKRFERSIIWHEYFYGRDSDNDFKAKVFKTQKTNMPKNYKTPEGLKTFLGSIKSEIMDHRNRNNVPSNLPQSEILAMKELIKLQKEKTIVIKPCDKGAGIIILD